MPVNNAPCTERHEWPPCADPDCIYRNIPGAALNKGMERPVNLALLNDELEYLTRLVHVDQTRMLEDADHARAYGARNYQMPAEAGLAEKLLHSFAMSRTAATLAAIEDMEKGRADSGQPLDRPL